MEEKKDVALDTIPKIFMDSVNQRKSKTAMREKHLGIWQSVTWTEYGEKSKYVGLGLKKLGLYKNDVVSIASEGIPEWLFTDIGTIFIIYIALETDPNKYDAYLQESISHQLAADLAYAITNNATLANQYMTRADERLREARFIDATENALGTIESSEFTDARL